MKKKTLVTLEPKLVWKYFKAISQIPRPSKKEEKIRAWIRSWADDHGIVWREDKVGNLILQKNAVEGCEGCPSIVLQGHLDMVCQKIPDKSINFETDPIPVMIRDNKVMADGTSLGADNGIGIALALAVLTTPIKTGPIEVVFTVDEETGLTGAFQMEEGFFSGEKLINLDSEDLGTVYIGSAGGGGIQISVDKKMEKVPRDWVTLQIVIEGLQGGHSGVDINKRRKNAIKLMHDLFVDLGKTSEFRICNFSGGTAHNAIPRSATSIVSIPQSKVDAVQDYYEGWKDMQQEEISVLEPNLSTSFSEIEQEKQLTLKTTQNLIKLLGKIPHGVISWSEELKDLVNTSNNLATIEFEEQVIIHCSTRSFNEEKLEQVRSEIKELAQEIGATVKLGATYPGWEPESQSQFTQYIQNEYEEILGESVDLKAIHAGLECGLLKRLNPKLEIVSIGPEIKNPHSPNEYVEISSVEIIWKVLRTILEHSYKLSKEEE